MPIRKPVDPRNIAQIAKKNNQLGMGFRGTSFADANDVKKRGRIYSAKTRGMYTHNAPHIVTDKKKFTDQLINTIQQTAAFAASHGSTGLKDWRNWKKNEKWPCIMIMGKHPKYRGGGNLTEFGLQIRPGKSAATVELFPKHTFFDVKASHVLAIVSPTKREMRQIEKEVFAEVRPGEGGLYIDQLLFVKYTNLMVKKTVEKLHHVYKKHIDALDTEK
jgi:hypothetical protein